MSTPLPNSLKSFTGLSDDDVKQAQEKDGYNELPTQKKHGVLAVAFEIIREPMFVLLISAGLLYLFMGEIGDALLLFSFVFVVIGITIVQQQRTEHALEALRDLSSPHALVIRNSLQIKIPGREVVCHDLVILSEGDRIPADGILRSSTNLSADESLLTGESVPVRKTMSSSAQSLDRPGGDDLPSVYSGTLVISGQGVAEVISIGARTELGKIGKALELVKPEITPLQKETSRLVRNLAIIGLIACAVVAIVYGLTRGANATAWKDGLLAGITMAMAVLPEEFPVILTIFLALGAWRISHRQVLTRRMPAIETLGAVTVLCVDKTGTLTQNQMTLKQLSIKKQTLLLSESKNKELPETFRTLLKTSLLASKTVPFDPMEKAIHLAGNNYLEKITQELPQWKMLREYSLSPELLAVTNAWAKNDEPNFAIIAAKGAPEAIADLCHMLPNERAELTAEVIVLASQGLRVLGVAQGKIATLDLPNLQHDMRFQFLGLIGFEDPLRPTVPAAVATCQAAGIRVAMITGDYPATAQNIARQAGFANCESVITGEELEQMSDDTLAQKIKNVQIFARVVPEQKLRIVTALKANNEVVAMTGDGVNDAPALKAAHIGIAMGARGTDVAREAASLILLDDDFSSIVAAIHLGRRIYDNIKKAVAFTLAVHIPIAGLSMLPVFFADWPLLLLPIHVVFLELIIDPSCTLIFEAEEADERIMERLPRNPKERLFSKKTITIALLQGFSALAACLSIFLFARHNHPVDTARALTFLTLVVSLVVIILVNRSWTNNIIKIMFMPNKAMWWVIFGTATFLLAIFFIPIISKNFHFGKLHAADIVVSLLAGLICVLWFEGIKFTKWFANGQQKVPL